MYIIIKVDVSQYQKTYCLQARPCIFQPGNCTGLGSEGVNLLSFPAEKAHASCLLTEHLLQSSRNVSHYTIITLHDSGL